jgi:uncharacterized protein
MVTRTIKNLIEQNLFRQKAIIIFGARQVGKTTLVEELLRNFAGETLFLSGDDADTRELLTNINATSLIPVFGSKWIVVIDEAQRIPDTGLALKIIHDNFKDIQLIATGSSAFELATKISEPLTGRKFEFFLHPFSFEEMVSYHGFLDEKRLLEHRMIFGSYPDIALNVGNETKLIKNLASSFLYKDLLMLEQIKKPALLEKILKALALQVGSEVSFNELGQLTSSDKNTVEKYIGLLEQAYIIFRLEGLNRNVRNEIKKGRKIYFFDNGIRNAILGNFQPLSSRTDLGALWENFFISERFKYLTNKDADFKRFFWRTTQKQEIDYIEEMDGILTAFELKWNSNAGARLSTTFTKAYPETALHLVHPKNYHTFLMDDYSTGTML